MTLCLIRDINNIKKGLNCGSDIASLIIDMRSWLYRMTITDEMIMRSILLFFVTYLSILNVYGQIQIFRTGDSGNIITSPEYIEPFINGNRSDIKPYILKETSVINTDVGYTIRCLRYNGWENETGDFNVIEINTGQGEVLNLQYDEGWERVSMPGLQCGNKPFYHETLVNGEVALFFTGATLMSQPPYLTIIILAHGRAYLVFNKRMIVNNVVRENEDLSFNLQENVIEWTDEYTPADDAVLHTISIKNGLMYFE